MVDEFYKKELSNLVDELKELIAINENSSITELDNLELGVLEGEQKIYKNMLIKVLTILVEGGKTIGQ